MLQYIYKDFTKLSINKLYALINLRVEVFIIEQNCIYQDLDYKDQCATHFLCYDANKLVGYSRVLFDKDKNSMSLGRVITKPTHRNQGIAKQLMKNMLVFLDAKHKDEQIVISAQCYLKQFYSSFGFDVVGDEYKVDGLPHIKMIKKINTLLKPE